MWSPDVYDGIDESWYLRDINGNKIFWVGYPDRPLMDISNIGWQQKFIKNANKTLSETGADGILIDVLVNSWPPGSDFSSTPKNLNESSLKKYNKQFLDNIIKNLDKKYLITYNGLQPFPDSFNLDGIHTEFNNKKYLDNTNGTLIEYFIAKKTMWDEFWNYMGYNGWNLSTELLKYSADKNKITLVLANDTITDKESRIYSLASFLLFQTSKTYFYYEDGKEENIYWFPEWELGIGDPLGKSYVNNSIYQRDFTKAKILVNPTNLTRNVYLDKVYKTLEGKLVSVVSMNKYSGNVLLSCNSDGTNINKICDLNCGASTNCNGKAPSTSWCDNNKITESTCNSNCQYSSSTTKSCSCAGGCFTLPYTLEVVIPTVSFIVLFLVEIIIVALIIKKLQPKNSKKI